MENKGFFSKFSAIVLFLILEMLALISFNFANISHELALVCVVLTVCATAIVLRTTANKKDFLVLLIPVALLFVVSCFNAFNNFAQGYSQKPILNISALLSLPAFFALGFFVKNLKGAKTKGFVLAIGAGLALVTLISTLATLFEYGPFYPLITKAKGTTSYYYDGNMFDVTKEMYWLFGFNFSECLIEYGGLYGVLCASYLPSLLFIDKKEHKYEFIEVIAIGSIGVFSLIIIPNFAGLIISAIIFVFAIVYKYFKNNKKIMKIIGISVISLVGLALVFYFITLLNAALGFPFGGFLERLFEENRIMTSVTKFLTEFFGTSYVGSSNILGFTPSIVDGIIKQENTGIFEIQVLEEAGLIGGLIFVLFFIGMLYFVFRNLNHGKDDDFSKILYLSFIISFFVYSSLFNVTKPEVHNEYIDGFLRNNLTLITVFLLGILFENPFKKEEKTNEKA